MNSQKLDIKIIKILLLVALLILGIIYFGKISEIALNLWKIVTPLVIGLFIAYIVNILMKKINLVYFPNSTNNLINKSRKTISLVISFIIIILILIAIINIILPQIFDTFSIIASAIPKINKQINEFIIKNEKYFPAIAEKINDMNIDLESISKNIINYLTKGISGIFNSSFGIVSTIASSLFNFFMALTFSIYLLLGKEKLLEQMKNVQKAFMKEEHIKKINKYLKVANESFTSFITGQCTEAIVLGILCTTGMLILKFPYAMTVGVFVGATALIPMVGAYIGSGVGAFLILMISPIKAIWFLVYIIILQQLEGNLIYPKVVGTSIGLPGVWVLVAIVIGGGFGGIIGMLLGVPIMATIYKLLQIETRERLAKNKK